VDVVRGGGGGCCWHASLCTTASAQRMLQPAPSEHPPPNPINWQPSLHFRQSCLKPNPQTPTPKPPHPSLPPPLPPLLPPPMPLPIDANSLTRLSWLEDFFVCVQPLMLEPNVRVKLSGFAGISRRPTSRRRCDGSQPQLACETRWHVTHVSSRLTGRASLSVILQTRYSSSMHTRPVLPLESQPNLRVKCWCC